MKKIALFGASGKTGQQVLMQALEQGYEVQALARTPSKIRQSSPRLRVIQGDVLNPAAVDLTIQGADIVVSLFGHVKGSPEWLQTNGTKNIVEAMKRHGVHRIISLSGGGLPYPEKDQPKFADKLIRTIMKIAVPKILNDAVAHHRVLEESGLDWVIVRGPRLTDGPRTNKYRVSWVGVNSGIQISRADLADFILREVETAQFHRAMPFVTA